MRSARASMQRGMHGAPESLVGKWTLALASVAVAGLVLSAVGFATGVLETASSFGDDWFLTTWGAAILASGVASLVTGAVALLRRRDRSWAVLLATLVGLFVTAAMLNEVLQGL